MLPTRKEAEKLLAEAEKCNPGPWGNHSRVAAHCAEKIAQECDSLDSEKLKVIEDALETVTMDEYDKLIQLCDSIAGSEGVLDIEERMGDVRNRYGSYPQEKWDNNLKLKKHFEDMMGKDIYAVTRN